MRFYFKDNFDYKNYVRKVMLQFVIGGVGYFWSMTFIWVCWELEGKFFIGVTNIIIEKQFLLLFTIFIIKHNYYYNKFSIGFT